MSSQEFKQLLESVIFENENVTIGVDKGIHLPSHPSVSIVDGGMFQFIKGKHSDVKNYIAKHTNLGHDYMDKELKNQSQHAHIFK
jgi:hypothetical protein